MDARDNSHPRANLDAYRFSDDVQLCTSDGCSSIMQNLPRCSGSAHAESCRLWTACARVEQFGEGERKVGGCGKAPILTQCCWTALLLCAAARVHRAQQRRRFTASASKKRCE